MDILDLVGNTPLVTLRRVFGGCDGVEVVAKAEYFNPGGSVKDRAVRGMLLAGERDGQLAPGKTILAPVKRVFWSASQPAPTWLASASCSKPAREGYS